MLQTSALESAAPGGPTTSPPHHVAIIMDGNGRWATQRNLPRLAGHKRGVEQVREIVRASADFGIRILTLYAFSTENWKRPPDEVFGLMQLFAHYMRREVASLKRDGVRLRFIGDRHQLSPELVQLMNQAEEATRDGLRLTLQVAINYGGRAELVQAMQSLAQLVAEGKLCPDQIDEAAVAARLATGDLPDPDLIIRTSGEQRISNFMIWQAAYAEFFFAPELWPDFDRAALARALAAFDKRDRRYGGVKT